MTRDHLKPLTDDEEMGDEYEEEDDDLGDLPPLDEIERREVVTTREPAPRAAEPVSRQYPQPQRNGEDDGEDEDWIEALNSPLPGGQQRPPKKRVEDQSMTYLCYRHGMQSEEGEEIWGEHTREELAMKLWALYPNPTVWRCIPYRGAKKKERGPAFDLRLESDPRLQPTPPMELPEHAVKDGVVTPEFLLQFMRQLREQHPGVNPQPVSSGGGSFWDHIDKITALAATAAPLLKQMLSGPAEIAKAQMEGLQLGMKVMQDAEQPNWKSMLTAMAAGVPNLAAGVLQMQAAKGEQPPALPDAEKAEAQLPAPPVKRETPKGSPWMRAHLAIAQLLNQEGEHPKQQPSYWAFELLHSLPPEGLQAMYSNGPAKQAELFVSDLKAAGAPVPANHEAWWQEYFQFAEMYQQAARDQGEEESDEDGEVQP